MSEHTKGKITAYGQDLVPPTDGEPWGTIAGLPSVLHGRSEVFTPADARRLAACWNACEGVPTGALENGIVAILLKAAREAGAT